MSPRGEEEGERKAPAVTAAKWRRRRGARSGNANGANNCRLKRKNKGLSGRASAHLPKKKMKGRRRKTRERYGEETPALLLFEPGDAVGAAAG